MTILIPNHGKRKIRGNNDLDNITDNNSQESNENQTNDTNLKLTTSESTTKNTDVDLEEFLRMPIPELEESKRKTRGKQKRELFNNVCYCIFFCLLIFFSLRGCNPDPGYYDEGAQEYRYGR